jgi:hypothetical protein
MIEREKALATGIIRPFAGPSRAEKRLLADERDRLLSVAAPEATDREIRFEPI